MWARETGIEGHLRCGMETQCSGNLLKYIKVNPVRSPNIRGYGVPSGYLWLQNKTSSSEILLHSIKFLAKRVSWKFLNNTGFFFFFDNGLLSTN